MRIGIAGISGRMGRLVAEAAALGGAELAGGVSRSGQGPAGARLFAAAADLARACDVLIDFTHPGTIANHAKAVRDAGCAWVLGTTGLEPCAQDIVREAAEHLTVVQAANFSPGMTLVLALAERLARALPPEEYDAEIVEMHHRQKVDAPSGTALALGEAVAAGRATALAEVVQTSRVGQTGPRPAGAIGIASLRGGQVAGEHTLLFAAAGEHISLSHHAIDRGIFARGAVRAAFWAGAAHAPGLYSMMDVLGLADGRMEGFQPA